MGRMYSASVHHQLKVLFGKRIKGTTFHLHSKCPSYAVASLRDLNGTVFLYTTGNVNFNACLVKEIYIYVHKSTRKYFACLLLRGVCPA